MEAQIIELEKNFWQGMEEHNYEKVKSLTRFPCIVAGKTGVKSIAEPTFKKMFESGSGAKIKVLGISSVEAQTVGEMAIIGYEIDLGFQDDPQKPGMKCICTSTWIKESGKWLCALHTETEVS